MRFSVRQADVCAGEERRTLRKSAFWLRVLTKKCTLRSWWVQNVLFREVVDTECVFP